MKEAVCLCDMCAAEGTVRLAVARYWSTVNEVWDTCEEHLGSVKEAGLRFERFEEEGNVSLL